MVQLTQALYGLGDAGAGFSELTRQASAWRSFGVNAKYMLYTMREAADGTISDSQLMLAANSAIVTGVTTERAGNGALLHRGAKARADAFGLSSAWRSTRSLPASATLRRVCSNNSATQLTSPKRTRAYAASSAKPPTN